MLRRTQLVHTLCFPLCVLLVAACSDGTPTTAERVPDGSQDTLSPSVQTTSCAARLANARPFGVATTAALVHVTSECGDVAWIDDAGAVVFLGVDQATPSTVASLPAADVKNGAARLALAATGKFLAYRAKDGVHRVSLVDRRAEDVYAADGSDDFGFVNAGATNDDDRVVICGRTTGLRLGGETASANEASCSTLVTTGGPYAIGWLGAPENAEIAALAATDGAVRHLPALTQNLAGKLNHFGQAIETGLSHDGRTLLFAHHETNAAGDTFQHSNLTVRLVDLVTGKTSDTTSVVPGNVGSNTKIADFAIPAGPFRVALGTAKGAIWQTQDGTTGTTTEPGLRAIESDGVRGLFLSNASDGKTKNLVRHALAGGAETVLAPDIDTFTGSHSQAFLAAGQIPSDGIRYPDKPGVSHAQIWPLVAITPTGTHALASSTQPLVPVWVGDDGAILVRGALADGALPSVAAPADLPTQTVGLHAFAPDGSRLGTATYAMNGAITRAAHGVLVLGVEPGPIRRLLYVSGSGVASSLADEAVVARIGSPRPVFVDDTGTIAIIAGRSVGDSPRDIVLAGALPR
jgi:hypothetical protein